MVPSGSYKLGPKDGHLTVKIDPEGLGKGMAHSLKLEVKDWSADVNVADDIKQSSVSVTADLGSLDVIWSSGQMSAKDKTDIMKNAGKTLSGKTNATFKSKSVSGDDKRATVSGDLAVGGSTSSATMTLTLTDSKASGTMDVRHSALGIKPYSAPLGVIKVKDGVTVEFEANLPS